MVARQLDGEDQPQLAEREKVRAQLRQLEPARRLQLRGDSTISDAKYAKSAYLNASPWTTAAMVRWTGIERFDLDSNDNGARSRPLSPKRRRYQPPAADRRAGPAGWRGRLTSRPLAPLLLVILGGAVVIALAVLLSTKDVPATRPTPISIVETEDVHSLAFLDYSSQHIVLGHHGGILESNDGGRTWSPWGSGADAMAMGVAGEEPIIVAGHDVLALGTRDGRWDEIANDLPNTDIHGFARDPRDAAHVWAYLATGGLHESRDGGTHWSEVFAGHALGLFAIARGDVTWLMAVDPERGAIVASEDGGRTWQARGVPPSTPVYALAGASGGDTILMSGSDGMFRSDDGGATFSRAIDAGQPILAIAVGSDAGSIVLAGRDGSMYRSDDGGRAWPAE